MAMAAFPTNVSQAPVDLGGDFADPSDPCTQCEQGYNEVNQAWQQLTQVCNSCQTQRNLQMQTSGSCEQCQQAQQVIQKTQQQLQQMGGCQSCGQPMITGGTTPPGTLLQGPGSMLTSMVPPPTTQRMGTYYGQPVYHRPMGY